MIFTIYAHHTGFPKVRERAVSAFPKAKIAFGTQDGSEWLTLDIEGGFFKKSGRLMIRYRQKEQASYQFPPNDNSDLGRNLRGLYNYVAGLPTSNEKVKNKFLRKIETLNCEFSIQQEGGEIKGLPALIAQLAADFDAILFVQPGTLISKSATQHFLDKDLNLILDQQGHCEVDDLDVKIESATFDIPQHNATEDQETRKARSMAILNEMQIKVIDHLPYIESEADTTIRSAREIAQRVAVLGMVNLVAFGHVPGNDARQYLQQYNLWSFVTPGEQAFLDNPTEEQKTKETWKCEDIWVLLWALGAVEALPSPANMCDLGTLERHQYPTVQDKDPNEFIEAMTTTRSKQEIMDVNDLYYRLDWACVDARLHGRELTNAHPVVVYERHYALNWLVNYGGQEWDDVSCDT